MKKLILSLGFIILLGSVNLIAQQRELSLDEALKLALENNKTIKSAEFKEKVARAEWNQSKAAFLPSLELHMTGLRTNDPLSSFGFKLKQEIVTQADFDPAILNDPLRIDNFSTKLEMRLPILNLDALYMNKAAKLGYEASSYMKERNIQYVLFEVKKVYYGLELADEVVNVVKESVQMAESALKVTKDNLDAGYAKEADVLMAKVRLGDIKAKLIEAENMRKNTEEYLVLLLGLDQGSSILIKDQMNMSPDLFLSEGNISKRSDIMAVRTGVKARRNMLNASRSGFLPRINAFGSAEWNDNNFLGTNAKNYTFGAMLSWKLFNGYKNVGGVQKARFEYEKSKNDFDDYLNKNNLELQKARRDLKLAFEQAQIKKLGKKQAAESYRIINDRYTEGLEKTVDLLYAETLASNRKLEFIESLYKYQIALSYVELLLEK